MRRRDLIKGIAASVSWWPVAARGQQVAPMRQIGMLMNLTDGDPEAKRRIDAFAKALGELGWTEGKNFRSQYRFGVDTEIVKKNAAEMVALAPDVIIANAPPERHGAAAGNPYYSGGIRGGH
ncbi:MAG TPA: hypothetical protein VH206_15855 [Xanthobacteraceae bacterium]|jgi:hypothetical protein|nr:hypothetical protein [Xanthobacteraceae bacterium]